jgi:hypothetical protein
MTRIDFSKVQDAQDFSPLPKGRYLCRIAEIEESMTMARDDMWKVKFEVQDDEFKRRYLYDNLVFNEIGLRRIKLLCSKLGLDMSGEIDLEPTMLLDKECVVEIDVEQYEDNFGKPKARNKVLFAGYHEALDASIDEEEKSKHEEGDDMPV